MNDCIHIRPNLDCVEEAVIVCDENDQYKTHVIMLSMSNYMVLMHDKEYSCFICNQVTKSIPKEKYIF